MPTQPGFLTNSQGGLFKAGDQAEFVGICDARCAGIRQDREPGAAASNSAPIPPGRTSSGRSVCRCVLSDKRRTGKEGGGGLVTAADVTAHVSKAIHGTEQPLDYAPKGHADSAPVRQNRPGTRAVVERIGTASGSIPSIPSTGVACLRGHVLMGSRADGSRVDGPRF